MKKNIFILPLLAISVLSGCTPPSNVESSPLSSKQEDPKGERIEAEEVDNAFVRFTLTEFDGTFTTSNIQVSIRLPSLSYGDRVITEGASLEYYAADINGDGFRELVFEEKLELETKPHYVVYDVKNDKRLFDQKNMTEQRYGYFVKYYLECGILDGHIAFKVFASESMDEQPIDYAHIRWSEKKGCYLELENPYDIKSIVLEGIYTTVGSTKLHLDGGRKEDGEAIDLYYLEKDTSYEMKITVVRGNFKEYLAPGFLSMEWDSNKSQTPTYYIWMRNCDPQTGKYVIEFSTSDITDFDLHDWTFYFGFYGFSFYSKVMQGLAN